MRTVFRKGALVVMHHRIEVIGPIACCTAFNLKIMPKIRKEAAAILHIFAVDLYIVVAIRPALFMEKAQTMQQLMHDNEFAIPTRYVDDLTAPWWTNQ